MTRRPIPGRTQLSSLLILSVLGCPTTLLVIPGCVERFDVGAGSEGGQTGSEGATTRGTTHDNDDGSGPTNDSSSGDTSSDPLCGNGIIDEGEECDEGAPAGLCTGCEYCQLRRTAYLNGETAFIEVADVDGRPLQLADTEFTVEAWVRVQDADDVVLVYRRPAYSLARRPETLGVVVPTVMSLEVELTLPGWHHIAWTFDGSLARLFVDGTAHGEASVETGVTPSNFPLEIGRFGLTEEKTYGRGRIDEVRISSVIRYASAGFSPARRFEPDSDTLLLLHLDGEAVDASPLGHNVSIIDVMWEPDDGYGVPDFCEGDDGR